MKTFKLLLTAIIFVFSASALFADVPQSLSIQGRLMDDAGQPVTDGAYEITISLYEKMDDTRAAWESTETAEVRNGIFSVMIGSDDNPLPEFSEEYWYGIALAGGEELSPRQKLSSVPYSFYSSKAKNSEHAVTADTADYLRESVMPVGTVLIFAGMKDMIPDGWMACDGTAMISSDYPELFMVLGRSWGNGSDDDNEDTNFNIPDLRGMFLRGVDGGSENDPDADFRQAAKPGGNEGANVGTMQTDASPSINADAFDQSVSFKPVETVGDDYREKVSGNVAAEVRPKNMSVYYIIKVK